MRVILNVVLYQLSLWPATSSKKPQGSEIKRKGVAGEQYLPRWGVILFALQEYEWLFYGDSKVEGPWRAPCQLRKPFKGLIPRERKGLNDWNRREQYPPCRGVIDMPFSQINKSPIYGECQSQSAKVLQQTGQQTWQTWIFQWQNLCWVSLAWYSTMDWRFIMIFLQTAKNEMFFSLYKYGLAKIKRWIKVRLATFKWITVYSQLVSTYNQVLIRGQLTKYWSTIG